MAERKPGDVDFFSACVCLGVQRAARATARRYDQALKPVGLTSGQFSILASLQQAGTLAVSAWADLLGQERTTLQRNLIPLEQDGLIEAVEDAKDKRVRRFRLTTAGVKRVRQGALLWARAQADSEKRLGKSGWASLRPIINQLAED